ncbi:acyl-CoA:lysophosphatidylglycerol acyltransferase 1 isoform X1 [Antechinus flavipes]|uniref:acyl-CoA:lysophosphatidylglycerol acyltransferase 1 isoform X1 n=2 Tax=Antechinus flavipes TaxID=38775 RepID=UPI0022369DC9|nr:acyl-CoA:lysophosphatidylglycerol acyltransferase 1 isoform X1 [Antechinus flavipes]XP_051854395.1 acyl-CoA:lysophosphatidylglycerol acyltransferase 1 isoform X1 [Antechinus flavipes]
MTPTPPPGTAAAAVPQHRAPSSRLSAPQTPAPPPPSPPPPTLLPPLSPALGCPSSGLQKEEASDLCVRMALSLEEVPWVCVTFVKAVLRFLFMVMNNLVAIPSYVFYIIILQPLRMLDRKQFWYIEGIMYKWLLAMVASWGWCAGYTVMEWGEDIKAISEDEAVMLVNHQATGDVCTLMMCLQDKGMVVAQMMWLMDHIFKYTNFGIVSLIHGDFFIRQGKSHRDQQLVLLKKHLKNYYRSRDRKWIVLFPEGGFLRKRRETSQAFAKKNNLPFLTHVTLPRLGATQIILNELVAQQENGTPAGGDARVIENKPKGLQWVIDTTIAYPKAEPIDIQTWILGYRRPTVTHVHYRIFPIKDVPLENDALANWLYQRFIEKEDLLSHFYETGAFPPLMGQKKAISKEMTLNNLWLFFIQSLAFLSGYMWYNILRYFYHCLF